MIVALVKEIHLTPIPSPAGEGCIETLYFGGGTPSILGIDDLKIIFEALRKRFQFADDIEITLEANPDDITPHKLWEWGSAGINRLSIGIQSFFDEELKWMNRVHSAADSLICIEQIKESGFTNFSADLIYGSPLLTDDGWKKNVEILVEKNIPHISCYALTVEPKTALHKMIAIKNREPVDAAKQAGQFVLLMDWMKQGSYEHYEISNFAKPGMRSRHNSSYWQGATYFGFGPSAHSFDGKNRRWNIANNAMYVQSLKNGIIPFEEETLTPTQHLNEYIMTALRTMEGLDLELVHSRFGVQNFEQLMAASEKWKAGGKLNNENGKIILTTEGKLFADGIAADLFF